MAYVDLLTAWRYLEGAHGHSSGFEAVAFDDSSWAVGNQPFGKNDLGGTQPILTAWPGADDDMCLRAHLNVPATATGVTLVIHVDFSGSVYFNGALVGTADHTTSGTNGITPGVAIVLGSWLVGDNVIAVRAFADANQHRFELRASLAGVDGVGTRGVTGPSLLIEYFDNNAATFGPSTLQGVILDALKIGWSWYSRYPSNAFFTLRANSVHNTRLLPLQTHIRITYYNPRTGYSAVVFTGRLSEPDHSGEDVVWTAWNYLSELSLSRSGYRTLYPGKLLGTEIAQVEWNAARTATYALLNFVTTGTIENPLGTDEATPIVTDNRFGVIDVPRLLLMFDLTEIGRANTVHNVTMGITRTSPFSFFFLKNAGTAKIGRRFVYPGNVRDFRYVPGYAALRNDLATIGTSPDGSAVEIVKTDEVNALAYGRRQDVFTIKTLQGQVGGATESDAQNAITARAVKEATNLSQSVLLDVRPELVEPFDGWDIEDTIKVEVYRGRVAINDTFRIIGARGLLDESGYHPQIYIQLPTQA